MSKTKDYQVRKLRADVNDSANTREIEFLGQMRKPP